MTMNDLNLGDPGDDLVKNSTKGTLSWTTSR